MGVWRFALSDLLNSWCRHRFGRAFSRIVTALSPGVINFGRSAARERCAAYFFSLSVAWLPCDFPAPCVGAAPVVVPLRGPVVLFRGCEGVISAGGVPPGVFGPNCGCGPPPACCASVAVPVSAASDAASISLRRLPLFTVVSMLADVNISLLKRSWSGQERRKLKP